MSEALTKIQEMLSELTNSMDSYLSGPEGAGEQMKADNTENYLRNLAQTESTAKKISEYFFNEETKKEVPNWIEQEKENLARAGLELFNRIEMLDRLAVSTSEASGVTDDESNPMYAATRATAGSIMQLLCVIRGFTQIINFLLIDATLALTYIFRDKIHKVIHLKKEMYTEVREAWRFRCAQQG